MINPIIIFGTGSLSKQVLETLKLNNILVYGFLDDDVSKKGKLIGEVPILGRTDDEMYLKFLGKKCDYFIAEDEHNVRKRVFETIYDSRKLLPINAIHPTTSISSTTTLGYGIFIGSNTVLDFGTLIGNLNIIQPHVYIGVETQIGECCTISQGVSIGSEVSIENNVFIGMGAIIVSGIKIGKNARIGAGSVVVEPVKSGETVFGNPAKKI
jgi:sugar O-acyltransferase (sialic acid O-acetyltransferase NeuD family)